MLGDLLGFRGILERFVDALSCLNAGFVSDETLEQLPDPAQIGQTRVGGIDLNKPRMRRVVEAVLALSASPAGFTATDLARQVHSMNGLPQAEYGKRRAAYDIKKFRAKGMVAEDREITPVRGSLCRTPHADRPPGIAGKDHQAITRRKASQIPYRRPIQHPLLPAHKTDCQNRPQTES